MNTINNYNLRKFAPVVLRFGMAFVFMWFGSNQLLNPGQWTNLIPVWITNMTGMNAGTFVFMNAIFEVIASVLLILGIQIRIIAVLLFLHIATIVADLGLNAISIRDIGIMSGLLSLVCHGADEFSVDKEPFVG